MGPVNPWPGSSSAVPTCSSCPFIVTVPDRLPQPQMTTLSTSRSPHLHPLQDPVYPTLFADQGSDSTATLLRGNYSRGIRHNGHLASTRFTQVNPCAANPQACISKRGSPRHQHHDGSAGDGVCLVIIRHLRQLQRTLHRMPVEYLSVQYPRCKAWLINRQYTGNDCFTLCPCHNLYEKWTPHHLPVFHCMQDIQLTHQLSTQDYFHDGHETSTQ